MFMTSVERIPEKERTDLEKVKKHLACIKETMDGEGIACETHGLVRSMTPGEDTVGFAVNKKVAVDKIKALIHGTN